MGILTEIDPVILLAAAAALALGGVVKGVIGFAFPMVSVPLLSSLVDVRFALVTMVAPVVIANFWQAVRGGYFVWASKRFWPIVAGLGLGIWTGANIAAAVNKETPSSSSARSSSFSRRSAISNPISTCPNGSRNRWGPRPAWRAASPAGCRPSGDRPCSCSWWPGTWTRTHLSAPWVCSGSPLRSSLPSPLRRWISWPWTAWSCRSWRSSRFWPAWASVCGCAASSTRIISAGWCC